MSYFVIGVNHKECPVAIRERLHFSESKRALALQTLHEQDESLELVILSTCNRVEFYGYHGSAQESLGKILDHIADVCKINRAEFEKFIYIYKGREAMRHLFRVVAGLDSLVVGENEILGQLRSSFRASNELRTVHSMLYRLMEKSLKCGKDVRNQTKINEGAVSIPSVAVELAEKIFGRLSSQKVMVLGTGEMSILTMKNLRNSGAEVAYVVNRSREKGEPVAIDFGAEWVDISEWQKYMAQVDIVIASTAAPHVLVFEDQVRAVMKKRRHKPLFLIDISVPRNIEAHIDTIDDVYLYNIDDLKGVSASNLKLRSREIEAAESKVDEAVLAFQSWVEQLSARPTLERYENFLDEVLEKDLKGLVHDLGLSESQKNEIQGRLRSKLLHLPMQKIKEASKNGGVARYVEALDSLFNLEQGKSK